MTSSLPSFGITRERIVELTTRARSRRIVVVGDVMLDRYLLGDTERLSPEAPVPVLTVRETRSALGALPMSPPMWRPSGRPASWWA